MVQSFQWQFVSMKSASSLQSPTDSGEFCFISCFTLDGFRECVIGTLVSASALILSQGSWFTWIFKKEKKNGFYKIAALPCPQSGLTIDSYFSLDKSNIMGSQRMIQTGGR